MNVKNELFAFSFKGEILCYLCELLETILIRLVIANPKSN